MLLLPILAGVALGLHRIEVGWCYDKTFQLQRAVIQTRFNVFDNLVPSVVLVSPLSTWGKNLPILWACVNSLRELAYISCK